MEIVAFIVPADSRQSNKNSRNYHQLSHVERHAQAVFCAVSAGEKGR
jgi:hypothetical protein